MSTLKYELYGGTIAIGTHGGIFLHNGQLNAGCLVKMSEDAFAYPACHMLEQAGWRLHFLIYNFEEFGIVQGIFHMIALSGLSKWIGHTNADDEVASRQTLLLKHTVMGVKAQIAKLDIRFFDFHSSF